MIRWIGPGSRSIGRGVRWSWRGQSAHSSKIIRSVAVLVALMLAGAAHAPHRVERGETLWGIARSHGTTVEALADANALANPRLIRVGTVLAIPGDAPPAQPAPAPASAVPERKHTVVKGENLSSIAARYGTTAGKLAGMNSIRQRNLIRPGQVLIVPGPPSVEELLVHYANEFGMNPALVKGLAWHESGWKQGVVSKAGAIGVMQLMPETAEFVGRHLLGSPVDPNDVEQNIKAGVRFLAHLHTLAGGDENLAIAGYFQGLRSVKAQGMTPAAQRFVGNVVALKRRFGG